MKLWTAAWTLNDHLASVGDWELLAAGKMLRSTLIPLRITICVIFSFLILSSFYILNFYVPVLLKCFTTSGLKSQIWSMKLRSTLEQLKLIKAFHKFSFIIKLTSTFRCVFVCVRSCMAPMTAKVLCARSWNPSRQCVGYNRLPYMRRENEIEPASRDLQRTIE